MTKFSRRASANIAAWRRGIPTTQAGVDAMWGGVVGKLNATIPASRAPIASGADFAGDGSTAPESVDAAVDWSSLASGLNREAGLATPARCARCFTWSRGRPPFSRGREAACVRTVPRRSGPDLPFVPFRRSGPPFST